MRKQVGMIDAALLAEVDDRAGLLGQTRRVFVERALEAALAESDEYLVQTNQADRIPASRQRPDGTTPNRPISVDENRADAFRRATQGKKR